MLLKKIINYHPIWFFPYVLRFYRAIRTYHGTSFYLSKPKN